MRLLLQITIIMHTQAARCRHNTRPGHDSHALGGVKGAPQHRAPAPRRHVATDAIRLPCSSTAHERIVGTGHILEATAHGRPTTPPHEHTPATRIAAVVRGGPTPQPRATRTSRCTHSLRPRRRKQHASPPLRKTHGALALLFQPPPTVDALRPQTHTHTRRRQPASRRW